MRIVVAPAEADLACQAVHYLKGVVDKYVKQVRGFLVTEHTGPPVGFVDMRTLARQSSGLVNSHRFRSGSG